MTTDLTPPPEVDLPPSLHGRRREELLAIVTHQHARVAPEQPRRRLPLAPTLISAAAVAGVIAAGVFGLPAYRDGHRPADPATQVPQPPAVRKLTAAETQDTLRKCAIQTNAIATGLKGRFAGSKVVDAFTLTRPAAAGTSTTWLVGRRFVTPGREAYEICGLDPSGKLMDAEMLLPYKVPGVPSEVPGLVSAYGRNHGQVSLPVARVTVQPSGGAEIGAVVRNGLWYAPIKGAPSPFLSWDEAQPLTNDSLIGIYPGVRLRGYAANGQLLYDSDRDAYSFAECFPSGGGSPVCPYVDWLRSDPER